jgi:hypothetical protein
MNVSMLNNKNDTHGPLARLSSTAGRKAGAATLFVGLRAAPAISRVAVLPSPFSVEQVAVLDVSRLTSRMPQGQKIHSIHVMRLGRSASMH